MFTIESPRSFGRFLGIYIHIAKHITGVLTLLVIVTEPVFIMCDEVKFELVIEISVLA
jgi:hypothetical protein